MQGMSKTGMAVALLTLCFCGVWSFQVPHSHLRSATFSSQSRGICQTHQTARFGTSLPRCVVLSTPKLRPGCSLRASAAATDDDEEIEDLEPIADAMTRLAGITDGNERMEQLREIYWRVDNEGMQLLAGKVSEGDAAWNTLLQDMQKLTQERMETGKETLMDLLASGEITVLDSKIVKAVKGGVIDPAFLTVLNLNLDNAQQAGESQSQQLQVLIHIYTRVQEEMEKRAKPSMGLVHKLLRLMSAEFAPTRANILEEALKPKPEEEREMVFVDGKLEADYGAKVAPLELSEAIVTYMNQIRGLDQVDGAKIDEDTIGQAFEDCRVIAKEARAVVERQYDQEALDAFTDSLTPVFEPIMNTLDKYRR